MSNHVVVCVVCLLTCLVGPLHAANDEVEMVQVPAGEFTMGGPGKDKDEDAQERPEHKLTLPEFSIDRTEVTTAQYCKFLNTLTAPKDETGRALLGMPNYLNIEEVNGRWQPKDGRETWPMGNVTWYGATAYAKWAGKRLPTEAEWEYACRAGTGTRFSFGDDESRLGEYAWYDENSGGATHPAGGRKPNAWGLYDMHGNVWEWCEDHHHERYAGAPSDGSAWGDAPQDSYRVFLRGGGWGSIPGFCRSAVRAGCTPGSRVFSLGFRVVLPAVR